jgi:hypothetical protein
VNHGRTGGSLPSPGTFFECPWVMS